MVHASGGSVTGAGPPPTADFTITLKGWRSQLRWAMTQREEDPARVWLEIISIDERSKRAVADARDEKQLADLKKFRGKLEESMTSLTEELGDENVAPLYSWLDLVRQRRQLARRIDEARGAVAQARAMRPTDGASSPPATDDEAVEQLGRAQGELDQWKTATPPPPPPEVVAAWVAQGGDALADGMPRDPMAVGKRGDEARRVLARAKGRAPGKHRWAGSRGERIAIAVAGAAFVLFAAFAAASPVPSSALRGLAALAAIALAGLLACGALVRRASKAELAAALDWVWHSRMYEERTRIAELEAGWLRALVDAQRAYKAFEAKAGTGGQLREFEKWRPDLADIVQEVARDTAEQPA